MTEDVACIRRYPKIGTEIDGGHYKSYDIICDVVIIQDCRNDREQLVEAVEYQQQSTESTVGVNRSLSHFRADILLHRNLGVTSHSCPNLH